MFLSELNIRSIHLKSTFLHKEPLRFGSQYTFFCLLSMVGARIGEVKRVTKETNVSVRINLDGSGVADSSTGIPFLDHMLDVSISLMNE